MLEVLADGSYRSQLLPAGSRTRSPARVGAPCPPGTPDAEILVRVIEYTVDNRDGAAEVIKVIATALGESGRTGCLDCQGDSPQTFSHGPVNVAEMGRCERGAGGVAREVTAVATRSGSRYSSTPAQPSGSCPAGCSTSPGRGRGSSCCTLSDE